MNADSAISYPGVCRAPETRTLRLTRQTTRDKDSYVKNRLQIPLPRRARWKRYDVVMDDEGSGGLFYGRGVDRKRAQWPMLAVSPIAGSVGLLMELMVDRGIQVDYLAVAGSLAAGEHSAGESDVDIVIVVKDRDFSRVEQLPRYLPGSVDLFAVRASEVDRLGRGIERHIFLNAVPIFDGIGLVEKIRRRPVDYRSVRALVDGELSLLESCREMIDFATTATERIACAGRIMLRLRAFYLTDCLIRNTLPRKERLLACLKKYGISEASVRWMYLASRIYTKYSHGTYDGIKAPSRELLVRIYAAVEAYGNHVKKRIGSA